LIKLHKEGLQKSYAISLYVLEQVSSEKLYVPLVILQRFLKLDGYSFYDRMLQINSFQENINYEGMFCLLD